jgi:predicted RNA-binding Zn-ribbon protein involved in translation (DUF1610 family)
MAEIVNHCASCGREIPPEEEFCSECLTKGLEACPKCGKVICECDIGEGD